MKYEILLLGLALVLIAMPIAQAVDLNTTMTAEEQQQFDQILIPIMKIYNFVKYSISAIAAIFLMFAAISFMSSGNDIVKREKSKTTAAYIIMGLIVIWAAPLAVTYLL